MTTFELPEVGERLPEWPGGGDIPIVFLVLAGTEVEQRICERWIDRYESTGPANRPDKILVRPPRTRGAAAPPQALMRRLSTGDDPLLTPIRAAWLPPGSKGVSPARLRDLLLGNPRAPGLVRQQLVAWRDPERYTVVAGEPATASELRSRFEQRVGSSSADLDAFASFVARQAVLATERAERNLVGARYKVPSLVVDEILSSAPFRAGIAGLAKVLHRSEPLVWQEAESDLKEMAAGHSKYVVDLIAALYRRVLAMGYDPHIDYDSRQFDALRQRMDRNAVVFLPSHRTYLDPVVLSWVLHEQGLPRNHTFGGSNIKFFPVSSLFRAAGGIFIRRSFKDDAVYKFVLRQYLGYVLEHRFNLEWYMEGGRSRTGKLLPPRMGLLKYVVDAFLSGRVDDLLLQPVAITYDQLYDVSSYVSEASGGVKGKENFRFFVEYLQSLRRGYGRVYVNLGEPVSLREVMGGLRPGATADLEGPPEEFEIDLQKVAFEVAVRINKVTPITWTSLVTMVLLGRCDRPMELKEITDQLGELLGYVSRHSLPVTAQGDASLDRRTLDVLQALSAHGVAVVEANGSSRTYGIPPEQQPVAAYYRNTIVHFFVNSAVAEMALVHTMGRMTAVGGVQGGAGDSGTGAFWEEVMGLRDLLKFEFFFPDKSQFRSQVADEISGHCPGWEQRLDTREEILDLLETFRPLSAHRSLRPFLDAYMITSRALTGRRTERIPIDPEEPTNAAFLNDCLSLGRQLQAEKVVCSSESVSQVLFASALKLAENRDLLAGPDLAERRQGFASEISERALRAQRIGTWASGGEPPG